MIGMVGLQKKVILVTGGSRGIGAVAVQTLVKGGADVILHYGQSTDQAQALAQAVGRQHCHLVGADLAQPNSAAQLWADALAWKGHIDVLVNNAGICLDATIDDDLETWNQSWQQTLQVNLVSLADLCREAIHHFRTRKGNGAANALATWQPSGIIINIASRAAFRGDSPAAMHYAASKGGVIALTRSIARGYAREGILAYAVAPGWVMTDMAEDYVKEHQADIERDIPMGTVAPPEDIANTISFLAAGLAPHMTGATLDINGASYVR
jgi:NAD(P)-dependent dehydrogenase (short-subunit alcohol dehydrogenase family)